MGDFDSLQKTKTSKRIGRSNVIEIYRHARKENKRFFIKRFTIIKYQ